MVLVTPSHGPDHRFLTGKGHLIRTGSRSRAIIVLGQATEDHQVLELDHPLEVLVHPEADHLDMDMVYLEAMGHQDITPPGFSPIPDTSLPLDMVHHDITPQGGMVHQDTDLLVQVMDGVARGLQVHGTVVAPDQDPQDTEVDPTPEVAQSEGTPVDHRRDQDPDLQESITHHQEILLQGLILSLHIWETKDHLHLVMRCLQMMSPGFQETRGPHPEYCPLGLST